MVKVSVHHGHVSSRRPERVPALVQIFVDSPHRVLARRKNLFCLSSAALTALFARTRVFVFAARDGERKGKIKQEEEKVRALARSTHSSDRAHGTMVDK